tara:strand:+ start:25348 stop:26688 length:1341 start_codon:yes stop_codon:yes gene_type:complete
MKKKQKTWKSSEVRNLYWRHDSEGEIVYGARVSSGGRPRFLNLETSDKKVAQRKLYAAIDKEVAKPKKKSKDMPRVEDYLREILSTLKLGNQRSSTVQSYEDNFNQLLRTAPKQFLRLKIDKVTASDLANWLETVFCAGRLCEGRGYAFNTVRLQWVALNIMFDRAIDEGLIGIKPRFKLVHKTMLARQLEWKAQRGKVARKPIPAGLQFEELVADIRSFKAKHPEKQQRAANWVMFLGATGLRIGEVQKLKWHHVDFENSLLDLRGVRLKNPNMAREQIDLNPIAKDALLRIWGLAETRVPLLDDQGEIQVDRKGAVFTQLLKRDLGTLKQDDYVMPVKDGRNALKASCERLGLPSFSPHSLRHFFCTCSIQNGHDFITVAAMAGHADASITAKRYTQFDEERSAKLAATWTTNPRVLAKPATNTVSAKRCLSRAPHLSVVDRSS